jgi:hypothetical protein
MTNNKKEKNKMALIASRGNSGTYTPAPEGTFDAVCCDVVDLGRQDTQ